MTDLVELRRIISELGYCTPDASLEFMALIPGEVRAKERALSERIGVLEGAVLEAKLARLNWQKYNAEQGDEVVYQAEKMASAIDNIVASLTQEPQ